MTAVNANGESAYSSVVSVTTGEALVGGRRHYIPEPTITYPSDISVIINSGDSETTSTDVNLTLSATNASEMMISNASDFSDASWETYLTTKSWTLTSGEGEKTVYVKFRSSSGGESSVVSDGIILRVPTEEEEGVAEEGIGEEEEEEITLPPEEEGVEVPSEVVPTRPSEIDLTKENQAIGEFGRLSGKLPSTSAEWKTVQFIAYGATSESKKLTPDQRVGILNEYKEIYGSYPTTDSDWNDLAKIAKGESPEKRNLAKEKEGIGLFGAIYGKLPSTVKDWNFVKWITYRIRPTVRDLAKERAAIGTFRSLKFFGNILPTTSLHWAVVRALAYIF